LSPHVLELNAFLGALIVAAARSVHVMITTVPAVARQVNPALQLQRHCHELGSRRHLELLRLGQILWPSPEGDLIIAGGQIDMFSVSAVYLGMKEEIRELVSSGVAARRQRIEANQALGSNLVFCSLELSLFPISQISHRQAVVFGERFFLWILQYSLDTVADDERCHGWRVVFILGGKND